MTHSTRVVDLARLRRRLLGPRPALLLGFAGLVVALLGAFTYVLVDSQAQTRREAEERFAAEARISAELTSAILTSSAGSGQAAAVKAYGGRTIDERALTASATGARERYALILDGNGQILAASRGTPASVRERVKASPSHVRQALAGSASFSDVLAAPTGKGAIIEWASPFPTPFGRRIKVDALDAGLIFRFLSGYLGGARDDDSSRAYVLDSRGRMLASSAGTAKAGDRLTSRGLLAALAAGPAGTYRSTAGDERYVTSSPVEGSTWRVVLTEPTSRLYPALAGSRSWLLFSVLGAFAVTGIAALLFFRRALQNGASLAEANEELTAVNASLEERVAERTAAAEAHARELARSNVELEQFSSVASHDLQEPLRKIRMFGDRLRAGLGDDLPEEPASDLNRMQNAAERMQRLIDDLLDFSRVTHRGKEFTRVDLGKIADEVLTDLEVRVLELDARVEVGDLPVIDADATQMRQLLQNLIGNALKFHREGEPPVVRISADVVSAREPRFAAESTAGDCCVLTVEDDGIGFDEQYAERVFTAFERLHSRSSYEGTGIGLSIARKIAWRHGGDITAKGAPDRGATFTVTLPLTHANGRNGSTNGHAP